MGGSPAYGSGKDGLSRVNHVVVIYQENHSFDNLYGRWEGVNGLRHAPRSRTVQVNQAGEPYDCLLQNDVNLTSPPLSVRCTDTTTGTAFSSHFRNRPFTIDHYIPPTATTCPPPGVSAPNGVPNGQGLPGGCTRDLVHRFYQEQYQLNDGRQNRYVTGSDAVGLAMGVYDTRALPIYRYLHGSGHPRYAIADSFFQAAFGGSFLNHQWLIAARNPVWPGAVNDGGADDLHSVVDENGMPVNDPLYVSPLGTAVKDLALTASCDPGPGRPPTPRGVLCGDYAVNTVQPP
ncbi:MAG: alkaline phosphatase family protein, partial [Actinomycetes bacterium]